MNPTREQVFEAIRAYGTQLDIVPTVDGITDAVMNLSAEAPQPKVLFRGEVFDAGGGYVSLVVNRDTDHYPETGTRVAVVIEGDLREQLAASREAPRPKVLWEGGLNDLLHAVNGTPMMSPLLDAAVAPDDPDAHKIRVAVVTETPQPAPLWRGEARRPPARWDWRKGDSYIRLRGVPPGTWVTVTETTPSEFGDISDA